MDGLECTIQTLQQVRASDSRIDSDYFSKKNMYLQRVLDSVGSKTIGEYGGYVDCSAFYPSITSYYSSDRQTIPFLRFNEINNGLISITDDTVFLPAHVIEENRDTIALAYPGDIIIAKGGNTLAKVGLVTDEYSIYATCRDVIILRTKDLNGLNKYYLWAFLHSSYGQDILWRSASQTGQPHLTLPAIAQIKVPDISEMQAVIEVIYGQSVELKKKSEILYCHSEEILTDLLGIQEMEQPSPVYTVKSFSDSFLRTGRFDAEYYQPKYDKLVDCLRNFQCKKLGGDNGIVEVKRSIEPGTDAYQDGGVPFIRVSDVSKFGISETSIHVPSDIVDSIESLFPQRDTILFSKDGSVGIAYKMEEDARFITSGALLHLIIHNPNEILPDYLTLVLNSPIVQLQAERDSSGAIIRHWKPSEIEKVVIPILDMPIQQDISNKIQESFSLRRRSKELLEYAKQAVEMAIEHGEGVASNWLRGKVSL